MHFVMSFGTVVDGWSSTAAYPSFGDDYWFRATANFGGIWWNSSNEAVYEMLHTDATGNTPTGDTTYTMRFEPGRTPDTVARAFWSLTIYGKPDYMLVPNPISRYNVSYRSGLATDDDGAITLHLAPELPDGIPRVELAAHTRRQSVHRRPAPLPPQDSSAHRRMETTRPRTGHLTYRIDGRWRAAPDHRRTHRTGGDWPRP